MEQRKKYKELTEYEKEEILWYLIRTGKPVKTVADDMNVAYHAVNLIIENKINIKKEAV
jgi:FixJ family two-component response regulator